MIHKHTISIKNAWVGLRWALGSQQNFRIHALLSLLSFIGGWFYRISQSEFLVIGMLVTLGFVIETINTAIEETTDAIDQKWREDIKRAKDVSAGAMLAFAIGAFIIACFIFVPKIAASTGIQF